MNEQNKVMNGFYNLAIMQAIHNLGDEPLYDTEALENFIAFVENLEVYSPRGEA
jgi:hypothetical protein